MTRSLLIVAAGHSASPCFRRSDIQRCVRASIEGSGFLLIASFPDRVSGAWQGCHELVGIPLHGDPVVVARVDVPEGDRRNVRQNRIGRQRFPSSKSTREMRIQFPSVGGDCRIGQESQRAGDHGEFLAPMAPMCPDLTIEDRVLELMHGFPTHEQSIDLPAKRGVRRVVAEVDCAAELSKLGSRTVQQLASGGGTEPHQGVVFGLVDLEVNVALEDWLEGWHFGSSLGDVQPLLAHVVQPRAQVEAKQLRDPQGDVGVAMRINGQSRHRGDARCTTPCSTSTTSNT